MRGGKREGSGRKKGNPTITISFRVSPEYAETLKALIKKKIETLKKLKNNE